MEKKSLNYLKSIGVTGALLAKVEVAYDFYTKYINISVNDMFISEFLNADGSRVYENLWFFNDNFCNELKSFMTSEEYDSDVIKDAVTNFTIKKQDFDIVDNIANDNSRMTLEFNMKHNRMGSMKASKENCKQLSMIFKKYIQPNFGSGI